MVYDTIEVTPVTPRIGAEVAGIDLTKTLGNRQVDEPQRALVEHQVRFFRDQPLDIESHKALGRCFGELHVHPAAFRRLLGQSQRPASRAVGLFSAGPLRPARHRQG